MKVLLLNQAFYPDVVATAQYSAELAEALAAVGHEVTVFCSSRAYDDPQTRFPRRESWKGVQIVRLPCSGLGKGARWRRAADFASFLLSCCLRLLVSPRFDLVIALTSPPLISVLGAMFVKIKGGKFVFWVMDLNPDEAVAAGWLRAGSLSEKMLAGLLRFSLRCSSRIIALDGFAKQRLVAKGISAESISVIPPWSHDDAIAFDARGRSRFRAQHGLEGKYVVMYSGNHSPCHPLDTLLEAARDLSTDSWILFCFVGGGSECEKVRRFRDAHRLTNIRQLPYQPWNELSASLSAADLQVVVMGDAFVGIVHPCKIYNLLAAGTPILYIGPAISHISAILRELAEQNQARSCRHGAVSEVVRHIVDGASGRLSSLPGTASSPRFSRRCLLPHMIAVLEAEADDRTTNPMAWRGNAELRHRHEGPGLDDPPSAREERRGASVSSS
jgi:colanic acid biosynthesis glycosyl transferase WcaI